MSRTLALVLVVASFATFVGCQRERNEAPPLSPVAHEVQQAAPIEAGDELPEEVLDQLAVYVREFPRWQKVDDLAHWAPELCRRPPEPAQRVSQSKDEETHGKKIYYQDNANGLLNSRREFEIYNGSVIPGNHSLSVEMVYQGNSDLFSYLKGYVFKLKSSYTFYATKGRITEVAVVGYERGGLGTDLEDKPYIKYEVKLIQNKKDKEAEGAAK